MKKYLKLSSTFAAFSIMRLTEYRASFLFTGIFKLTESIAGIIIMIIFLSINKNFPGWSSYQVLLIGLTFTLTLSLFSLFFVSGIKQYSDFLNQGNIDNYLIKPMNIPVYVSVSVWDWTQIFRVIGSILGIIYICLKYDLGINLITIVGYLIMIIFCLVICYAFVFGLTSIVLHTGRLRNVTYLSSILWQPGQWPTTIFSEVAKIVFFFVIPVWFAATFPVGILTGKYPPFYIVLGLIVAPISILFAKLIYTSGLKKYTSASS